MAEKRGMLLILSGPSGVGKTTVTQRVRAALDAELSISMTTRPPAEGERDGRDYHFVDEATFARHRAQGDLLEWAEVYGRAYGTPGAPVHRALEAGRCVLLEIDVQGALHVKGNMPEARAVFVLPPDEDTLLARLRQRQRDDEATIQRRFRKARDEIRRAKESGAYDLFVVNDDLERATNEILSLVWKGRAASSESHA